MSVAVDKLCFSYGEHQILNNLHFQAETGSLTAVLGRNGAGKTTLFRCLLGLNRDYSGTIRLNGRDARAFSARELAAIAAYIPQHHSHTFSFSALDMVLMGAAHVGSIFSAPGKRQMERAQRSMEQLGIASLAHKSFTRLSGGEQQLVLIARALLQGGRILIMDEPTAALDFGNRSLVLAQLRALRESGYTILMSTHDPQQALWYADHVLALSQDSGAIFGRTEDVLTGELLSKIYNTGISVIDTGRGRVILPDLGRCV